jgi:hypothetical protein
MVNIPLNENTVAKRAARDAAVIFRRQPKIYDVIKKSERTGVAIPNPTGF